MITLVLDSGLKVPITQPGGRPREFTGDRLVQVRLYGALAKVAGRKVFELAISSVREAINALHCLTSGRTTQYIDQTNDRVRWRVLVNGKQINGDSPGVADELMIERSLESIDLYPVMEGAANWLGAILGAILLVVGIVLYFIPGLGALAHLLAIDLIVAGIAGVLGGLVSLFSSPSKAPKQKATQNNPSYLFSGVVNTQDQGGPVPVAYGQVIIGSQTISAFVSNSDLFGTSPTTSSAWETGTQLPAPFSVAAQREAGIGLRATAVTTPWPQLGPSAFWGYCAGVTVFPNVPNIPMLQEPVGKYPNGPVWMMRFDNGGLVANYTEGGNNGPWECLRDCPIEVAPIVVTMAAENYADFAPTPNLP